jgi:hypothetical protein
MLSGRERRILHEIESQLAASSRHARQRVIIAVHAIALAGAAAALATATTLTASGMLLDTVGAPLIAVAGTITGWQLLSHARRLALGPRLRWRLRHRAGRAGCGDRPATG